MSAWNKNPPFGGEILEISRKMVGEQELERRWIAHELHDSANQILSSAKHYLQSALHKAAYLNSPGLSKDVSKAQELVEIAIAEIRRISQNLRPSVLDDLGFAAAVGNLCEDFKDRTRAQVELKCPRVRKEYRSDIGVTLYRIIQEALSNIEKHSDATRVSVDMTESGDRVHLTIKDNGKGFEPEQVRSKKEVQSGLGLMHIRERALLAGGETRVESTPGRGTQVSVWIPLKRRVSDFRREHEKNKSPHCG